MADYTRDENLADARALADMLRTIYDCPKPTIARVQGDVLCRRHGPGGGLRHRGRRVDTAQLLPERGASSA